MKVVGQLCNHMYRTYYAVPSDMASVSSCSRQNQNREFGKNEYRSQYLCPSYSYTAL